MSSRRALRSGTREHIVFEFPWCTVGGGDQAELAAARLGFSEPLIVAFIEHAQQARLQRMRQLTNLVQEERGLMRGAYQPGALRHPCLRITASIPEQLCISEAFGNGGRVA
jgi:hypothetical protein